jgi:hypothetical protein
MEMTVNANSNGRKAMECITNTVHDTQRSGRIEKRKSLAVSQIITPQLIHKRKFLKGKKSFDASRFPFFHRRSESENIPPTTGGITRDRLENAAKLGILQVRRRWSESRPFTPLQINLPPRPIAPISQPISRPWFENPRKAPIPQGTKYSDFLAIPKTPQPTKISPIPTPSACNAIVAVDKTNRSGF